MNLTGEEESNQDPGQRKTAILSAEELFRWRKKEVLPVPQRGGIKDFEPDGSWLQDKCLETFYEEHLSVLAEPRVEKRGNLVKGTWDSEMKLVNIEKTAKFWMKMGFAESDRNWLHPEEALFLMEVNCLEVMHHGVSLSLQEAYSLLLHPSCNVSEEEYQVFAHLRRLGYIVLRHAGKLDITRYEMKIGLHNYTRKKNKKHSMKSKTAQNLTPETGKQTDSTAAAVENQQQGNTFAESDPGKTQKSSHSGHKKNEEHVVEDGSSTYRKTMRRESPTALHHAVLSDSVKGERHFKNRDFGNAECERLCENSKRKSQESEKQFEEMKKDGTEFERLSQDNIKDSSDYGRLCEESSSKGPELALTTQTGHKRTDNTQDNVNSDSTRTEPPKKKIKLDSQCGTESSSAFSPELRSWSDATLQSFSGQSCSTLTEWDFSIIQFPDIAGKDTVSLTIPSSHCLPPNVCVDEEYEDICMFDVEEYRQQQHPSSVIDQEEGSRHLRQLEFSYAEWYKKNFRPVAARNWREWKEGFRQQEKSFLLDSPVAHLWQGDVTPLVQPQDSHSTDSLLKRLSVIQPYQGPFPAKERHEAIKISFDVYLPNTTFRKSCPGLPDHRVCVARGSQPPDLFDVHAATAHLDDSVPLHWAVVSSGDICFFVFEDLHLPVHPSSLG